MCGIAGVVGAPVAEEELSALVERMGRTLHHRGPDDFGPSSTSAWGSGIACCRLAISDPAGRPPADGERGRHRRGGVRTARSTTIASCAPSCSRAVTASERLRHRGDRPPLRRARSRAFVESLRGMFAIAVLDRRRRRVVLARDRIGMKPLYYAASPRGVVFGSEIKAAVRVRSGGAGARPRRRSTPISPAATCRRRAPASPASSKVRPGRAVRDPRRRRASRDAELLALRVRRGEASRPAIASSPTSSTRLLEAAVRDHLDADVPVGVLASGGLDSTLVALHAARASSSARRRSSPSSSPRAPASTKDRRRERWREHSGPSITRSSSAAPTSRSCLPAVVRNLDTPCVAAPALLQYRLAQQTATWSRP